MKGMPYPLITPSRHGSYFSRKIHVLYEMARHLTFDERSHYRVGYKNSGSVEVIEAIPLNQQLPIVPERIHIAYSAILHSEKKLSSQSSKFH